MCVAGPQRPRVCDVLGSVCPLHSSLEQGLCLDEHSWSRGSVLGAALEFPTLGVLHPCPRLVL